MLKRLLAKYPQHRQMVKAVTDKLIEERYSRNTLSQYTGKLVALAAALDLDDLAEAREEAIKGYLVRLAGSNASNSLVNLVVSAVKFYYSKVVFRPDIAVDGIKRPRKVTRLPHILSQQEIERILKALTNIKHVAILYTLYSSGLRLNESPNG